MLAPQLPGLSARRGGLVPVEKRLEEALFFETVIWVIMRPELPPSAASVLVQGGDLALYYNNEAT